MWAFTNWMRQSLRENLPVDQFVREIITAQGSIYANGPANYFKIATTPEDLAETTVQVFLGVRLQCARCHHHPFEVYSQQDYYGLAAFFTRVRTKGSTDFGALGRDTVVMIRDSGSIKHPRSRQVVPPTPLLGEPVELSDVRDLRRPLADWLTAPENDLFAKNIVNRFWGYFMGAGLVEPIDDMRGDQPGFRSGAARCAGGGFHSQRLQPQTLDANDHDLARLSAFVRSPGRELGPGAAVPALQRQAHASRSAAGRH